MNTSTASKPSTLAVTLDKHPNNLKMNDQHRVDKALQYLDKLFPNLPEFATFNVSEIMINAGWKPEEVEDGYDLDHIIQILLVDRLKYANGKDDAYWIKLNDLGRQVKSKGGHFAYEKYIEEKSFEEKKRQEQKDASDAIDFKKKNWEFKNRRLPYILSSLALLGTLISIFIAYKSLKTKQVPPDLREVQEQIKIMTNRMNRFDTSYRVDSLRKTDTSHIQ